MIGIRTHWRKIAIVFFGIFLVNAPLLMAAYWFFWIGRWSKKFKLKRKMTVEKKTE